MTLRDYLAIRCGGDPKEWSAFKASGSAWKCKNGENKRKPSLKLDKSRVNSVNPHRLSKKW